MLRVDLPHGIEVSALVFGGASIAGPAAPNGTPTGWNRGWEVHTESLVQYCLLRGLDFFDTSEVYGLGYCQRFLGEVLKDSACNASVVAKICYPGDSVDVEEYVDKALVRSLTRMQRTSFEVVLLHDHPIASLRTGSGMQALRRAQQQGKAHLIGLACRASRSHAALLERLRPDIVEVPFSVLEPLAARTLFPEALQFGIPVIAVRVLGEGRLSERYINGNSDSWQASSTNVREWVRKLDRLRHTREPTLAQSALAFALAHPAVKCAAVGSLDRTHIDEAIAAIPLAAAKQWETREVLTCWEGHRESHLRYRPPHHYVDPLRDI